MTPDDLSTIESRATLATPAPWSISGASVWSGETHVADFTSNEDALFCARAREDVPAMVAEVQALRDQLAEANEIIRDLNAQLVSMVERAQRGSVGDADDHEPLYRGHGD